VWIGVVFGLDLVIVDAGPKIAWFAQILTCNFQSLDGLETWALLTLASMNLSASASPSA